MKGIIILLALAFSSYTLFFKNGKSELSISDPVESYSAPADIRLTGLNRFEESDISLAKKTIERVFGFRCEITDPIKTDYNSSKFVTEDAQDEFGNPTTFRYDSDERITIFVTSSDLYSYGLNVRGICYGNQIYVQDDKIKINVIHEISHSLGLEHCEKECIMNSHAMNRWNEKTDSPIYCEDCKSKIRF